MKVLSKQDIISVNDDELVEYEIEEWGGSVLLSAMSVGERLALDEKFCDESGKFKNYNDPNLIYTLLTTCIKDEEGATLFGMDEIGFLKEKNSKVIHKLFYEIMKLNYQTVDSIDDAKKK